MRSRGAPTISPTSRDLMPTSAFGCSTSGARGWIAAVPAVHRSAATTGDDLIFIALEHTIRTRQLPRSLFHDLLSAFRQDVDDDALRDVA